MKFEIVSSKEIHGIKLNKVQAAFHLYKQKVITFSERRGIYNDSYNSTSDWERLK